MQVESEKLCQKNFKTAAGSDRLLKSVELFRNLPIAALTNDGDSDK
jgi:hypothetical protein